MVDTQGSQNNPNSSNINNSQAQFQGQLVAGGQVSGVEGGDGGKKKYFFLGAILLLVVFLVLLIVFFPGGGDSGDTITPVISSGDSSDDVSSGSLGSDSDDLLLIELVYDEFEISDFAFSYGSDKFDIDSRNPSREFYLGEDIFVYLDIKGFEQEVRDGEYYHEVVEDVVVYGPSGEKVEDLSAVGLDKSVGSSDEMYDKIEFYLQLQTNNLDDSGEYVLEIVYHDIVSGEYISEEYSFVLKKVSDVAGLRTAVFEPNLIEDLGIEAGSEFVQKVEVYDSSGNLVDDLSYEQSLVTPEGFNGEYLNEIAIPSYYEEGQYVVRLSLENTETGKVSELSKTVLVEDSLVVSSYYFSDYALIGDTSLPKSNNEYVAGEQVYLHMELEGFRQESVEGGYHYHVVEDIEVYDPLGEKLELLSAENYLDEDLVIESKMLFLVVENSFILPDYLPSGDYKILVKFYDELSDDFYEKEFEFKVEGVWSLD